MTMNTVPVSPSAGERTLWDSVALPGITKAKRGDLVAYYLNGRKFAVPSVAYVEGLFSPELYRLVPIDVVGDRAADARVVDVETEDVDPNSLEQWIQDFNEGNPSYDGGGRAEVYCSRDTIPAVRTGTGQYLLGRDYYLWIATGDGTLYRGPGVNACQNVWSRTFDSSVVYDPRWMPGVGSAD